MIIKCEKCQTSFRLPDEKIKPEGTKVRCSRCKNIFTVFPAKKEVEKIAVELEEKTKIGFIPSSFGEDKDDDSPINIKRQKNGFSPSVESLGHGIPLSSPEIKQIKEPDQGLSEIMSAIETGIKDQISSIPEVTPTPINDHPAEESKTTTLESEKIPVEQSSFNGSSPDIGSLLNSISNITDKTIDSDKETGEPPPEELPDLSALLSATFQGDNNNSEQMNKDQPPIQNGIPDIPLPEIDDLINEKPATSQNPPITASQPHSEEEKISMDIDKVFDSLFTGGKTVSLPDQIPPQEGQPRKTLLYMESVPVAPQNLEQPQAKAPQTPPHPTMQIPEIQLPTPQKSLESSQIQDNLLNDDLSMFLSSQTSTQNSTAIPPKPPSLNTSDDLLAELSVPKTTDNSMGTEIAPTKQLFDMGGDITFGEPVSDTSNSLEQSNIKTFSPNANRSDDLLSQMDSIDNLPVTSQNQYAPVLTGLEVRKPQDTGTDITTSSESNSNKVELKKDVMAPVKPATIALKETAKSTKSEIFRWMFILTIGCAIVFASLYPSKIFPSINANIITTIGKPLTNNSISIENLYFKKLNNSDTLLIFTGSVNLRDAISPDNILLSFKISDLSGSEIIQTEYPLTYTENFDEVINISGFNNIKDFLAKNRLKTIIHKKIPFIAPLIVRNLEITDIDVKSSVKISSK